MRTRLVAAVAALVLLAGCSAAASDQPASAHDLAAKLGCATAKLAAHPTLYAKSEILCHQYDITTYGSNGDRDQAVKVGQSFGAASWVEGDRWAIGVDSAAAAKRVQAKVGGEVH